LIDTFGPWPAAVIPPRSSPIQPNLLLLAAPAPDQMEVEEFQGFISGGPGLENEIKTRFPPD
jgi:hypothetical protein